MVVQECKAGKLLNVINLKKRVNECVHDEEEWHVCSGRVGLVKFIARLLSF